MALHKFNIITF